MHCVFSYAKNNLHAKKNLAFYVGSTKQEQTSGRRSPEEVEQQVSVTTIEATSATVCGGGGGIFSPFTG